MIALRDYQKEGVDKIQSALKTGHNPLFCLPTGGGKTVVMGKVLSSYRKPFVIAHTRFLVEQLGNRLPPQCEVRTIQSIRATESTLWSYANTHDILCIDEAHHSTAESYRRLIEAFKQAGKPVLGVTATPKSANKGVGFDEFYHELIEVISISELISLGYLAPYEYYKGSASTVFTERAGELIYKNEQSFVDTLQLEIHKIQEFIQERKALLFLPDIRYAKIVSEAIPSCNMLTSKMKASAQEATMDWFRESKQAALCVIDIFNEGVDVPDADTAILLRPTLSLPVYLQQIGRILRPFEGKTARILDLVGNYTRHGLPCAPRQWSLNGEEKGNGDAPCKGCPECGKISLNWVQVCSCKYEFTRPVAQPSGEILVHIPSELDQYLEPLLLEARRLEVNGWALNRLISDFYAKEDEGLDRWAKVRIIKRLAETMAKEGMTAILNYNRDFKKTRALTDFELAYKDLPNLLTIREYSKESVR